MMDNSAYVKYSIKRMPHMEEGARLFVYLILNKVYFMLSLIRDDFHTAQKIEIFLYIVSHRLLATSITHTE